MWYPGHRSRVWWIIPPLILAGIATSLVFLYKGGCTLFAEWGSPACLVDANGDDVLDSVGFTFKPGSERRTLFIIDGTSGDVIWEGESDAYSYESSVVCAPPGAFAVVKKDFTIDVYDAAAQKKVGSAVLPDLTYKYGSGKECFSFLVGEETISISTEDASLAPCEPGEIYPVHLPGTIAGPSGRQKPAELDGMSFSISAKASGSRLLTVSARTGDQLSWEVPLKYVAITEELPLLVTEQTVITYGASPGDSDHGVLIGLDPKSGRIRYEHTHDTTWSTHYVVDFEYNGRYVIMVWGYGIHAYDPDTGERVWNIGGR